MPIPGRDALRLAELYRLALADVPPRGPAGERLGRGTGASLEFQDRRAYAAGDDVRHLDWRAFARTDQLMVRLWREEVLPRVEIVVDVSRSMAVDPGKAQVCTDLVAMLAAIAREDGAQPVVIALGDEPLIVAPEELAGRGLDLAARRTLLDVVPAALGLLRAGAVRIVVSDFLFPHDAAELVRPLASNAGALACLQLLTPDELAPRTGAQRLIDSESGEALDVVLDATTVARYRERLARLAEGLATECRRTRGRFAQLSSDEPLDVLCREQLARDGILAPR